MRPLETPDHHGSHRDLLWTPPEGSPRGTIDAIIVPTVRPPGYLSAAALLAERLACTLVTLHSGKWTSAAEAARRIGPDVRLVAIDVPAAGSLRLMDFETSRLLAGTRFARRADTSVKRNLALRLAYTAGWRRIVFLDDDIEVPRPEDLLEAAGLLGSYSAVGLANRGYPDNSVVCHAYRLTGGDQQSFIGGGAMAVDTARNRSFFPDIYNEDWFYMLDPEKGIQPVAVTGTVIQGPYDPFRNEDRARREELGDVLAEGIIWLLDQGRPLDAADGRHWGEFLARRKSFIEHILRHLGRAEVTDAERGRIEAALRASLGRLALIDAGLCERYLRAWIADRARWDAYVRNLGDVVPVDTAVRSLSGKGRSPLSCVMRGAGG